MTLTRGRVGLEPAGQWRHARQARHLKPSVKPSVRDVSQETGPRNADGEAEQWLDQPHALSDADALATLDHELRTPLMMLCASAELAAESTSLDVQAKVRLARRVNAAADWMLRLVETAGAWAALRNGKVTLERRAERVARLAADVVHLVEPVLERRGQWLQVELEAPDLAVDADRERLVQVLVNLVANASRYGPAGEAITLSATCRGSMVEFRVADRGPGVDGREKDEIFGWRVRGRAGGGHRGGQGLGLFIAAGLVRLHGGEIGVDAALGGGAVFWFTVPPASAPIVSGALRRWGQSESNAARLRRRRRNDEGSIG